MKNLTKNQIKFFEYLADIQELFVIIELESYKKGNSIKGHLYSITYDIIYSICEMFDGYGNSKLKLDLIDKDANEALRKGIELHDTCYDFLKQGEECYKIFPQILTKNQTKFFEHLSYIQESCVLNILKSYKENDNIEGLLYNITYDIIYYICKMSDGYNSNILYLEIIDKETSKPFKNGIEFYNICSYFLKKSN